jgi:hypothetical protein
LQIFDEGNTIRCIAIEFNPAAFNGVSEIDIRLAFDTVKYDGFLDEDDPDLSVLTERQT